MLVSNRRKKVKKPGVTLTGSDRGNAYNYTGLI